MAKKIEDYIKKIEALRDKLLQKENISPLAEKLKKQIVNRSRVSGLGVTDSGGLEKFDSLSDKYVEYRKSKKKNLSSKTKPGRSNITATGSLLESIDYEISKDTIRFYFKDTSRKDLNGKSVSIKNSEVASAMQQRYDENKKGGRQFFKLSNADKKTIIDEIRKAIKKLLD